MSEKELDTSRAAYTEQYPYLRENARMHTWFAERTAEGIEQRGYRSLLSFGIGHEIVPGFMIDRLAPKVESYTIMEGSQAMIDDFRQKHSPPEHVELVHTWFEEYQTDRQFDAMEMGFVLEHVKDPVALLQQFVPTLAPGGTMFIAVPNARSLHRVIGHHAGLLADMYALTKNDLWLGHRRYYDLPRLTADLQSSGLKMTTTKGIYLKPLTTSQLDSLDFSDDIVEALFAVAEGYPEIASAIYVEAQKAT